MPAAAVAGLGTGAVTAAALALIQDQASPEQLGVATSSATMLRNLGAAVGINGIAAGAAITSPPGRGSGDPVFWVLAAIALLLVLVPALFAPRRRVAVRVA